MIRVLLVLLALVLPPVGMFLWAGAGKATLAISALWLAGMAICWTLWAGPGLLVCALASIIAAAFILFRSCPVAASLASS